MDQDTIPVRYIGLKAKCTDSFPSGRIYTWLGAGDVQEVLDKDLPKVLKHPTVWEVVVREPSTGLADASSTSTAPPVDTKPKPEAAKTPEPTANDSGGPLDALGKDALLAYAAERKLKVPGNIKKEESIRAFIRASEAA